MLKSLPPTKLWLIFHDNCSFSMLSLFFSVSVLITICCSTLLSSTNLASRSVLQVS